MITKTLQLDHCWICGAKDTLEEHHVVPQAYGGVNGPMVTLCAQCHGGVHVVADKKPKEKQELGSLIQAHGTLRKNAGKASGLILAILTAGLAVKQDPNKSVVFSDRFPAETRKQLRVVAKSMGCNQQQAVRHAIKYLYMKISQETTK